MIDSVVHDLVNQLKNSDFGLNTSATGEWDWINSKHRNEYISALYSRDWESLAVFLLNPLSPATAYGIITPVDNSNVAEVFNNDFLKDLALFRSIHSIDEFKALQHDFLLKHPWDEATEPHSTYPDSPRHAHFALRIIQSVTNEKTGLEIGGGYGGLSYFMIKFGFRGKFINCDLLETLLVSYVFLRCNGVKVSLCLDREDLLRALESQVSVILITNDLFNFIGEEEKIGFVFNSRSFSEMSRETSKTYSEGINMRLKPDIVFSENAEELLFPNSERHLEVTQSELTSMLSSYKLTDNVRTTFMGGANRYSLRILNRLS
jgi:hypothetical protein